MNAGCSTGNWDGTSVMDAVTIDDVGNGLTVSELSSHADAVTDMTHTAHAII
jgi:hypothetical protein